MPVARTFRSIGFSSLFFFCFSDEAALIQLSRVQLILSSLFLGFKQALGKTLVQGWRVRQPAGGGGRSSVSLSYHAAVKFHTPRL